MDIEKKPLMILTGPTAVGKTELSLAFAEAIGGSIISADSIQVYKGMDIGSAKIKKEEMRGIPHYLIDILQPDEEFNVVLFQSLAKAAMDEIYSKGRIPIITGGTGFYIQSVLYDIDFSAEPEDTSLRTKYTELAGKYGNAYLHGLLKQVDPDSAASIHENNRKRVIRALEFHDKTGNRISEHNKAEREKQSPYDFCYFVLDDEREKLYDRINARIDTMIQEGLVAEVESLKRKGYSRDMVSMQGLGYKEILSYLDGESSYEDAIFTLKRDTRHFAKRQLTWFRREKDVIWVNKPEFQYDSAEILKYMLEKADPLIKQIGNNSREGQQ